MNFIKFWINNWKIRRDKIRRKKLEKKFNLIDERKKGNRCVCSLRNCKQKLKVVNRFRCSYCGREFCDKHRLPEDHDCRRNLTLPSEMKKIFESWSFKRNTD